MSDIYKNRRTYDPAELHDAGRRTVTAETCHTCHRADAPCIPVDRNAPKTGAESTDSVEPQLRVVDINDRSSYHERVPLTLRRSPHEIKRKGHQPNKENSP